MILIFIGVIIGMYIAKIRYELQRYRRNRRRVYENSHNNNNGTCSWVTREQIYQFSRIVPKTRMRKFYYKVRKQIRSERGE